MDSQSAGRTLQSCFEMLTFCTGLQSLLLQLLRMAWAAHLKLQPSLYLTWAVAPLTSACWTVLKASLKCWTQQVKT